MCCLNFKFLLYILYLHTFSLEVKIKECEIYTVFQISMQMFSTTLLHLKWS